MNYSTSVQKINAKQSLFWSVQNNKFVDLSSE
jgi:hypothetical protein